MKEYVWMQPPQGGPPVKVEANPETLVPLMVQGYTQTTDPADGPSAPQRGDQ